MCLGIPGRIAEVWQENGTVMAHAEYPGETRKICLAYLPDLKVGDYIIVHAGFALTRLSEEDAQETLRVMREYDVLDDPDDPSGPAGLRAAQMTGDAA
jgi:hydrogenase expression/formation protein HypC